MTFFSRQTRCEPLLSRAVALLAVMVPFVAACGDEPMSGNARSGLDIPDRVVLSQQALTLVSLSETVDLDARVLDAAGNEIVGATVEWQLQDSSILSVDAEGRITALANGYTPVRARVTHPVVGEPGVSSEAEVTVEQQVAELVFPYHGLRLGAIGGEAQLTLEAFDPGGRPVERPFEALWSSSDPAVVSVDDEGRVVAEGDGSALVRAQVASVSSMLEVDVDTALRLGACAVAGYDDPRAVVGTRAGGAAATESTVPDGCSELSLPRRR